MVSKLFTAAAVALVLGGCGGAGTTTLPAPLAQALPTGYVELTEQDYTVLDNSRLAASQWLNLPAVNDVYQYFSSSLGTITTSKGVEQVYGTTWWGIGNQPIIAVSSELAGATCAIVYVDAHELVHAKQVLNNEAWSNPLVVPYYERYEELEAYTRGPQLAQYISDQYGYGCNYGN